MAGVTIGKLAAAAGVSVETVRFYQRSGLLPEPKLALDLDGADRSRRCGPGADAAAGLVVS